VAFISAGFFVSERHIPAEDAFGREASSAFRGLNNAQLSDIK
jgi:hypothetical protein